MIDIDSISMEYGSTKALRDVSFNVKKNQILGLLGPNGAGKSTLMKILTTYLHPSSGHASIGSFDIINSPIEVRRIVGYLPENVPLYNDMRVDEYLIFVGQARGVSKQDLKNRLNWLKESVGIAVVWKHTINELSKGYRQRVGLAQALIHDPQVLILDEPTSGLDPLQIIGIRSLIKELAISKTIIFSTHILPEVEAIADNIVIINEGQIIAEGTRDMLQRQAFKEDRFSLIVKALRTEAEPAVKAIATLSSALITDDQNERLTFELRTHDAESCWLAIDQLVKEKQWPLVAFNRIDPDLEEIFISLLNKNNS